MSKPISIDAQARQVYYKIRDRLPTPWGTANPFNMPEGFVESLPEGECDKKGLAERIVEPTHAKWPFSMIRKELVKIKATPLLKKSHQRGYIFFNYLNNESQVDLANFQNGIEGEFYRKRRVNLSEKRSRAFLQSLVNISKLMTRDDSELVSDSEKRKLSRFFLIGKPGIGKTTFLNYLISVYADSILEKERALILRISLNKWASKDADFRTMIATKFRKVYYNDFFSKHKWNIHMDLFRDHVIDKWNCDDNQEKIDALDKEIRKFERGSPKVDEDFLAEMIDYLNQQGGISFIFIFDGLDYVTLDEVHTHKFKEWILQVDENILTSDMFRGAYIVTMRDISFQKALEYRHGSTDEHWRYAKRITIEGCDLGKMINRKLVEARRKIIKATINMRSSGSPYYDKWAWLLGPGVVKRITDDFLTFISIPFVRDVEDKLASINTRSQLENEVIAPGIRALDSITIENYRALMRNINFVSGLFYNIYERDPERSLTRTSLNDRLNRLYARSYNVLRVFIEGRVEVSDYRMPYTYKVENGLSVNITRRKQGMKFVIPPLHNFMDKPVSGLIQYRGLFKIRLLQFLYKCAETRTVNYVLNYFEDNFGYDKNACVYDIDEMLYTQLISVSDIDDYRNRLDCNVHITKLGEYAIFKLINWYIYYEVILDALPLPESLARQIYPINYYWGEASNLDKYNLYKARSVLLFLKYLNYVEEKEKSEFNSRQSLKFEPLREPYTKYFWAISPGVRDRVRSDIIGTFRKDMRTNRSKFMSEFENMSRRNIVNPYLA